MDKERAQVMIVDDDAVSLEIARNALADSYDVFTEQTSCGMFETLEMERPGLILLDVDMPEMDGFETIKILKEEESTRRIPVIFLTSMSDPESVLRGFSLGASDYMTKPFVPQLLRKRVELCFTLENQKSALIDQGRRLEEKNDELSRFNDGFQKRVEEKTEEVFTLRSDIMKTVAAIVEGRDNECGGHDERTRRGFEILMNALLETGVYKEELLGWDVELMLGASRLCLHDIGKLTASDSLLNKPGRLTAEEFDELKRNSAHGVRIIDRIESETSQNDLLKYARIYADTIRERWDGNGYPNGLSGEEIPLPGRLLSIADTYDALTSERSYKKALSHEEAVRIITDGSGTSFDPLLVDLFTRAENTFRNLTGEA